jgi:hypothetical protein
MSDKRTFNPGRLLTGLFGIARGITNNDLLATASNVQVTLQTYNSGVWGTSMDRFNNPNVVTAVPGLPINNSIPKSSIVWMFYIYKTYFIVLASC